MYYHRLSRVLRNLFAPFAFFAVKSFVFLGVLSEPSAFSAF
jgi:hypothetical protein